MDEIRIDLDRLAKMFGVAPETVKVVRLDTDRNKLVIEFVRGA